MTSHYPAEFSRFVDRLRGSRSWWRASALVYAPAVFRVPETAVGCAIKFAFMRVTSDKRFFLFAFRFGVFAGATVPSARRIVSAFCLVVVAAARVSEACAGAGKEQNKSGDGEKLPHRSKPPGQRHRNWSSLFPVWRRSVARHWYNQVGTCGSRSHEARRPGLSA